jgi:hypothetical protein
MQLTKRGGVYHVWFSLRGRKTSRSTGKSNLRAAEARGREIIDAAREQRWDALEKTKARRSDISIAAILDIYLGVKGTPGIHTCRRFVAVANAACLRRVCTLGAGKQPERCSLTDLDREAVSKFHKEIVSRGRTPERGETSARTTLRKARGVFAVNLLPHYPPSVKTALAGFVEAGRAIRGGSASHPGFVPFPPRTLREIYRDAITIRKRYPAAWRFFLLMVRCGLSNSEAYAARGTWLRSGAIHIPPSDCDWRPKTKNRIRSIPIRPDRYRRWLSEFEGKETRICVNGLYIQRAVLSPMLRKHIPNRQKALYELRKHAGSLVATRDGIYAAARFLGDRVETAERFYATLLKPLRPL